MNKKIEKKKGFTLVELVIVLAVLVIAAGMAITFSTMMHGAQSVSNARYEALQDVRTAESLIEGFIENNAGNATEVGFDENGALVFNGETTTASFKFFNSNVVKILVITVGENPVQMQVDNIDAITFEIVDASGNVCKQKGDEYISLSSDTLYYCTITYDVGGTPFTYTFCVNPYVGEK